MPVISDDEQRSYRAKSWLSKGLRRRRAMALSQLLSDVRRRRRRCSSPLLRQRSQRSPRDFCHGLPKAQSPLAKFLRRSRSNAVPKLPR
jgi:hypothetical protein